MQTIRQLVLPTEVDGSVVDVLYNLPSGGSSSPEDLGIGYGVCNSAYVSSTKQVTMAGYNLVKGGMVAVRFTNAVNASATMNINSKGDKPILYRGVPIVSGIIKAGDTVTFIYDGTYYHLISSDNPWKARVNIQGDEGAEITITNTTYGISDTVILDNTGHGFYICKAPGTYVFSVPDE